jgi:hypothetical protein
MKKRSYFYRSMTGTLRSLRDLLKMSIRDRLENMLLL